MTTSTSWVQIAISDEGIGIPPEALERVWERLYQVDMAANRRFGGTGLGLSIVKETVTAHGGVAWLESTVDRGTTAFVALPLHTAS